MTAADPATLSLRLEFSGSPQDVMPCVAAIEDFLLDAGCAAVGARNMAVVAEELRTNIARYAWLSRKPGYCAVDVEAIPGTESVQVSLRTEDAGIAFDPTAAEGPDMEVALEDRPIGGLGVVLIKAMTDAQICRRAEALNILVLIKICPVIEGIIKILAMGRRWLP